VRNKAYASRCLVALAVLIAGWLDLPSSVGAQASRTEVIAQEQNAKAANLRPEGPSSLEHFVVRVERLPILSGGSGPYPWMGSAYRGTGLALGAAYMIRMAGRGQLNMVAGVSLRGSTLLKADARTRGIARDRLKLELDARHAKAKDVSFSGLGPNSLPDNPAQYDYRPAEVGATATLQAARWIELSGRYVWMDLWTDTHVSKPAPGAPGLGQDLAYHVVQTTAAIDWRTSPGYSTRGGFHRVTWSYYIEAQDRPFSFQRLEYEGVQLVPILREQWVLAVHGLVTVTRTEDAGDVPVVLSPTLGGGESLRGFETRRFTDRDRLLLTGEYRWRPSRYLDMAVFVDAGKVGARRRDLGLSNLETDWGFGARVHGPTFAVFHAEIAKSREGWHLVFSVGKEVL
jgi:hypothetical protein